MTAPTTDPQRALIGAALSGVPELDLIHDEDLADPRLAVVAGIVRELTDAGIPADPTTVLAHARATGTVTSAEAIQGFSLLLVELVAECPLPASARWYAVAVLDEAIRRRTAEAGERLIQAADGESLASLVELIDHEHHAVRDLAARRAAVAADQPPQLRAVGA